MIAAGTLLLLASIAAPGPEPALAAAKKAVELTRLEGPIEFDGVPDDEAWRGVPALPLTMYTPIFRGEATQRTEIRVAYDSENLYAAGWFYDTEPAAIRMNSLYRDRLSGDDTFALYVDPFNDDQNAKWFGTTPAGIRIDQLVSDDGATQNENWDGFWDVRTRVTEEGWFMEMKIPFATLGFHSTSLGVVAMGLTATRLVARKDERVTFPEIDPGFPFRRPSLAADVVLRDVKSGTPIYVTPFVLAGSARAAADGMAPGSSTSPRELGLDIRFPLSSRLTADFTVNTDFAQVEADGQQVALDRFPLFFPERRRFFQENSGLFDFVTAGGARLFHSRRIGLTPSGAPVRILAGVRLVGKMGRYEIGALNMETDGAAGTDRENTGVFRIRRPVLNSSSTVGAMATTYLSGDRHSASLAADASLRVHANEYLTLKFASTADNEARTAGGVLGRSLVDARWERRIGRGLSYTAQFSRAGLDYRPRLGFLPRRDFTTANVVANWFKFTDSSRFFRRIYPGGLAFSTFRNSDGALESGQYAFWVQWDTKAGGGGWIEPKWFRENVQSPFKVGGVVDIPAGVYDFADLQVQYSTAAGARLRTEIDFRAGTYFDGRRVQVIATPTWTASPHLDLGLNYQMTRLRFPVRGQSADIHLAGLRIRAAVDARLSGAALAQYNSTTRRLDVNLRLRYAVREGTDLWFVYNEGLDTETARRLPEQPGGVRSLARTFILKYSHTFGG